MKEVTYADIEQANAEISTTAIEKKNSKTGKMEAKPYAEVNQRVLAFRKVYPMGTINTTILSNENGICIFKADIADETGKLLATGTAYEKENSSFINRTSYIENCETSAIGRALGFAGFGISNGIASYEEVANAMLNQNAAPPAAPPKPGGNVDYRLMLIRELQKRNIDINEFAKEKKINGKTTPEEYRNILNELEAGE